MSTVMHAKRPWMYERCITVQKLVNKKKKG